MGTKDTWPCPLDRNNDNDATYGTSAVLGIMCPELVELWQNDESTLLFDAWLVENFPNMTCAWKKFNYHTLDNKTYIPTR